MSAATCASISSAENSSQSACRTSEMNNGLVSASSEAVSFVKSSCLSSTRARSCRERWKGAGSKSTKWRLGNKLTRNLM
eukprot:2196747-Pleurochrysis_carterae.AAC.1